MDVIVSFELNGHSDAAAAQRIEVGTAPEVPTVPVAAGWVFGGWFSDASLLEPFEFSAVVSADVTAYAKWTAEVVVPEPVAASLALVLDLTVGQAAAGATVTASGEGLREGSDLTVILRSAPVELVRETTAASGAFSATAALPAGLTAGAHTVTLSGVAADGTAMSRIAYLTVNTNGTVTYLSYAAAEPVSPVEPVPSPDPVSPAEPVTPSEPVPSPGPVSPSEPVASPEPVLPAEPVSPPETVTPAESVAPAVESGAPATEQERVLARTGFAGAPLGFVALLALLAGGALILGRRRSVS
jgi:uncharacterized repeat protein (TIGR02543 family)